MVKNLPALQVDLGSIPGLGRFPGEGNGWLPTPACLLGEVHGQRSLALYSLWAGKKSDMTEQLTLSLHIVNLGQLLRMFLFPLGGKS